MDEHALAAPHMFAREGDAAIEIVDRGGLEIGSREMEERDPCVAQHPLVVAIFFAKIDHRRHSVHVGESGNRLCREASADGQLFGQPAEPSDPTKIC
jgi:hypothetical protein